jgi:thioredoxin reductase
MSTFHKSNLPVAVIGGGPVGLAAAAHLIARGETPIVFEAGNSIGQNILQWGHVRMFSPWQYNIDKAARGLLESHGWKAPDDDKLPTGKELVEEYLLPLSQVPELKPHIHLNAKVIGIGRKDLDKVITKGRENLPFGLYVEVNDELQVFEAKAVIDASGTWANPNPSLSNGIWTKGEKNLQQKIFYGIPDVLGKHKERYASKKIMVVGSGHSAINAVLDLGKLKEQYPSTEIIWVVRKSRIEDVYGGQEKDELPARGELGIRIRQMVEAKTITVFNPFHIQELYGDEKIFARGTLNGTAITISDLDEVITCTGARPDVSFLRELRINLDPALECVAELAPLIDPNVHSCGTVRPHGEKELRQPEKNFYIVGMKSYGRAPTFLLATGYEQIRSIVAGLVGDWKAAEEVQLELPETGVCSVGLVNCCSEELPVASDSSCSSSSKPREISSSCCGSEPKKVQITSCCG